MSTVRAFAPPPPCDPVRTLMVAHDFSKPSEAALSHAIQFSRPFGSRLFVVHVQNPVDRLREFDGSAETENEQVQRQVGTLQNRLAATGLNHEVLHRVGNAADCLLTEATDVSADLVFLGSHGHHGTDPPRMGSTARELMRRLRCGTVLLGPAAVSTSQDGGLNGHIVYVTSLLHKTPALALAQKLAFATNSVVEIVCVIDRTMEFCDTAKHIRLQELCEELAHYLRARHITVRWRLVYGQSATLIPALAREKHSGLILLDSADEIEQSFGTTKAIQHTIHKAPCPVLVMPRDRSPKAVCGYDDPLCVHFSLVAQPEFTTSRELRDQSASESATKSHESRSTPLFENDRVLV